MIPFGSMVEYLPISAKDSTTMVRKFYLEYAQDVHWMREESGEEILWSQTFEQLENVDASEMHARRLNAKEVITQRGMKIVYSQSKMDQQNSGRDYGVRESTPRREQPVRSDDPRQELQGNPQGSQPTETKDDGEARRDFWSIQGDFIYRYHNDPRVQLYVPKEDTFPFHTEIH